MTKRDAARIIAAAAELEEMAMMHDQNERRDLGRPCWRHAANLRRYVDRESPQPNREPQNQHV